MTNADAPDGMGIPWEFVRDFAMMMHTVSHALSPECAEMEVWGALRLCGVDRLRDGRVGFHGNHADQREIQVSTGGFTGCYDQGFWNAAGTFGIFVGLRFVSGQLG